MMIEHSGICNEIIHLRVGTVIIITVIIIILQFISEKKLLIVI